MCGMSMNHSSYSAFSVQPLCPRAPVVGNSPGSYHRDTKDTEVPQRRISRLSLCVIRFRTSRLFSLSCWGPPFELTVWIYTNRITGLDSCFDFHGFLSSRVELTVRVHAWTAARFDLGFYLHQLSCRSLQLSRSDPCVVHHRL